MEKISSRKNRIICHMRAAASDPAYRSEVGQFICDGEKTLREAIEYGAEIVQVLWREGAHTDELPPETEQYCAPADLVEYASPLKSGPGPVFTVKIPEQSRDQRIMRAIVIENLQDIEDDEEIFESIEDIWPDYPSKDDFFFNEDEY